MKVDIHGTKILAQNLLKELAEDGKEREMATVLALNGDLGSGKTTFMQFFGEALGVKEKIQSPTFVIEKIYSIDPARTDFPVPFDHLIHIDAYRLESDFEMINLGWKEIISNPRNIICIEWADKIKNLLPQDTVYLDFVHHTEGERIIKKTP